MEKRDYIEKILVDEKAIGEITARIAKEIDEAYAAERTDFSFSAFLRAPSYLWATL